MVVEWVDQATRGVEGYSGVWVNGRAMAVVWGGFDVYGSGLMEICGGDVGLYLTLSNLHSGLCISRSLSTFYSSSFLFFIYLSIFINNLRSFCYFVKGLIFLVWFYFILFYLRSFCKRVNGFFFFFWGLGWALFGVN